MEKVVFSDNLMKRLISEISKDVGEETTAELYSRREQLRFNFRSYKIAEAVKAIVYDKVNMMTLCQETGFPYQEVMEQLQQFKKDNDLIEGPAAKKPRKGVIVEAKKRKNVIMTLNEVDEDALYDHIVYLVEMGYGVNKTDLLMMAAIALNGVWNKDNRQSLVSPGDGWYNSFAKRFPDLPKIVSDRVQVGPSHQEAHFKELKSACQLSALGRAAFYVFDEVCIELAGKTPRILNPMQRKPLTTITHNLKLMFVLVNSVKAVPPKFLQAPYTKNETKVNRKTVLVSMARLFRSYLVGLLDAGQIRTPAVVFFDPHLLYVDMTVIRDLFKRRLFLFPLPPHPETKAGCRGSLLAPFQARFSEAVSSQKYMNCWPNVKRLVETLLVEEGPEDAFARLGLGHVLKR